MRFSFFLALMAVTSAVNNFDAVNAEEEVVIKAVATERWENAISKVINSLKQRTQTNPESAIVKGKTNNAANPTKLRAHATLDKDLETAIVKFNAGAMLKKLDTSPGKEWKTTYDKFKTSGELKNVDEVQAAKITEGVAQEIAKNPSKWRYITTAAEITLGATLMVLIAVGFQSMIE